jgi:hypothetical protein
VESLVGEVPRPSIGGVGTTFRPGSGRGTVAPAAMTDAALCFGWVATDAHTLGRHAVVTVWLIWTVDQPWSELERAAATRLIEAGRMTQAGVGALPQEMQSGIHLISSHLHHGTTGSRGASARPPSVATRRPSRRRVQPSPGRGERTRPTACPDLVVGSRSRGRGNWRMRCGRTPNGRCNRGRAGDGPS